MNLGNEWSAKDESNNTGDRVGEFKVEQQGEMSRGEPPITKSVRAGVCQLKLRRKDVMLVSMYCYMFVFSI